MKNTAIIGFDAMLEPLVAALNRLAAAQERIAAAEERNAQTARVHAEASCVIASQMKAEREDAKKKSV